MNLETYFFDSYALHELIMGNPNYTKYSANIGIITSKLNLMELHYIILRKYDLKSANKYYDKFNEFCVDIDDETIKNANEFKLLMKNQNLSYVDCIGYILAKSKGIKFLTGDKEFKELPNVKYEK